MLGLVTKVSTVSTEATAEKVDGEKVTDKGTDKATGTARVKDKATDMARVTDKDMVKVKGKDMAKVTVRDMDKEAMMVMVGMVMETPMKTVLIHTRILAQDLEVRVPLPTVQAAPAVQALAQAVQALAQVVLATVQVVLATVQAQEADQDQAVDLDLEVDQVVDQASIQAVAVARPSLVITLGLDLDRHFQVATSLMLDQLEVTSMFISMTQTLVTAALIAVPHPHRPHQ